MIEIYCDGASRRDGRGGWGLVAYKEGVESFCAYGGDTETTNNRMELMAAIMVCRFLQPKQSAKVYSDSKYVVDGILDHADIWLRNNWRTGGNKELKNLDLWQELVELDCERLVSWVWVKGHSNLLGNDRADELAGLGVPKVII